jgi:hypothetical protein
VDEDSKGNIPNKNKLSSFYFNNYPLHTADEPTFADRRIFNGFCRDLNFHNPPLIPILSQLNPVYVLPA